MAGWPIVRVQLTRLKVKKLVVNRTVAVSSCSEREMKRKTLSVFVLTSSPNQSGEVWEGKSSG